MDEADFKDIAKKYASTYFQYKRKDEEEWHTCYAEEIRIWYAENPEQVDHFIVRTRSMNLKSIDYDFKFDFPPIGVLNYKDTVVITNKYPQRQWKKAARSDNFAVHTPTNWVLDQVRWQYILPKNTTMVFTWNTGNVHLLFKRTYFTYADAIMLLSLGKRMAAAITNEFFITNSHYNKSILLWRYNCIVAEIHDKKIVYLEPMFEQETIDFFKRNT